jgi:hypothetical protein
MSQHVPGASLPYVDRIAVIARREPVALAQTEAWIRDCHLAAEQTGGSDMALSHAAVDWPSRSRRRGEVGARSPGSSPGGRSAIAAHG